jgi:hypothetical protein
MAYVGLSLAALVFATPAFLAGHYTRSAWAIAWPLAGLVVLAALAVVVGPGPDDADCYEQCGVDNVPLVMIVFGPPALVWVLSAAAGRATRVIGRRRTGKAARSPSGQAPGCPASR